jgi:hypothetical protein
MKMGMMVHSAYRAWPRDDRNGESSKAPVSPGVFVTEVKSAIHTLAQSIFAREENA